MGYFIGNDILDDEYNIFVTGAANGIVNHAVPNITSVLGTGTGDKGLGQSVPVSPVTAGADITATQWASLVGAINNIAAHQGTTLGAITSPTGGDDIQILTNLNQNLTDVYFNRLNCAATGTPYTSGGTVTRSTAWQNSLTATINITFSSFSHMRYFFNAGGRITFSGSRTGGAASAKNTAWTDFLADIGTLNLTAATGTNSSTIAGSFYRGFEKTGGGGTPSTYVQTEGMHDLTASYQELFRQYDTAYLYTTNYVRYRVLRSGATITIEVQYVDSETDAPGEVIDGNTNFIVTAVPAATTFISNSWGTPSISGSVTGS